MIWGRKTEIKLSRKKRTYREPYIAFLLIDTAGIFIYLTAYLPYLKKEPSEDQLKQREQEQPRALALEAHLIHLG